MGEVGASHGLAIHQGSEDGAGAGLLRGVNQGR